MSKSSQACLILNAPNVLLMEDVASSQGIGYDQSFILVIFKIPMLI